MANRKFEAYVSNDTGNTWTKVRSAGWAISDAHAEEQEDDWGFVIALTWDGTMVDIGIPERMIKMMIKDVEKLKVSEDGYRLRRGLQAVEVDKTDTGEED